MGTDPALFFANLFLSYYESEWVKSKFKTNPEIVRFFYYVYRFINDLILNGGNYFDRYFSEIYPTELELKKENNLSIKASFLDRFIEVSGHKFQTSLYDKRDGFNFDIVRMPNKKSNIPMKMFYSTINSELLRICRATSIYPNFLKSSKEVINRMIRQGAIKNLLRNSISRLLNKHSEFTKYSMKFRKIVADLDI